MKVAVFTLGCKTNLYESCQIVASLRAAGHDAALGLFAADAVVINTCAITAEAERKSRQAVSRARRLSPDCKVFVVGCASQKDSVRFCGIEGVKFVMGTEFKEKIAEYLDDSGQDVEAIPSYYHHGVDAPQERTRAFVKIQDGCNRFCSYCIVPYLRGRSRSKDYLVAAREVASSGSAETVLIGIDISQYGLDNGQSLAMLINAISHVDTRVRLGSLEASSITDETLQALSALPRFCPHFHLSLQSGSDSVLKRMNRHYTAEQFRQAVGKVRRYFPNAALTTDVIVGFCGETQQEFDETCKFVQEIGFADVHVFPFSQRPGTAAFGKDDVPPEEKKRRAEILSEIKKQLKANFAAKHVGQICEVLTEERKNGFLQGYTPDYLKVYFKGSAVEGEVVKVKILRPYGDGAEGEILS